MINKLIDDIDQRVDEIINLSHRVKPEELGLDTRAGWQVYIDQDMEGILVSSSDVRTMNYYGGFEYVDKEFVRNVGRYTMYLAEADRVRECIERWKGDVEQESNED